MKKKYQKIMMAVAVAASMGYALPSWAADATVNTNKVWLSGATHIYGRMTTSGITSSNIKEQGFCYSSTNKTPTVDDQTSHVYLTNNGNIYNLSGLEPATVYYIRAYVTLKSGDVVYGAPVKAITRPKGSVSYGIRDGFPADALTRIEKAAKEAIDLWNEYTGIHGLYVSIGYGASTPTADCSYGGWMQVGPNASYQRTGTLLHEMLHAIGVGTIATWYGPDSFLRESGSRGYWLGTRATRALRFWDNSTTSRLNGDGTHMWPYGVNGAHEDAGTQLLYVGNSLLAEALGEDGLAPTASQFATPAYVFEQDDDTKYYLKNEEYGMASKFLRIDKNGNLQWIAMDADKATQNDSVAWNVTFDPATCYYTLKNVATGRYLTYSSTGTNGIKTKVTETITDKERFHFLPSPVEVAQVNGETKTGFWIGNVSNNTMNCLTAQNSNYVKANGLNFSNEGGSQRWLILTAQETQELANSLKGKAMEELNALLDKMEVLLDVPHQETEEGADATFRAAINKMRTVASTSTADEIEKMNDDANTAVRTFLGKVNATSPEQPFDISFLIQNADMEAATGWSVSPSISYSCGEFYQKNFDLNQKLTRMPAGVYMLKAQAFQRPGATTTVYQDYQAGNDKVNAYIYLISSTNKQNICNIMADAQDTQLGVGKESTVGSQYVPNDMQAASKYFAEGLYENTVKTTLKYRGTLTLGLKSEANAASNYWTICDNFRLYYYGTAEPTTGIKDVTTAAPARSLGVYTLGGQLVRKESHSLQGLPQGIYVVNGKKVVVK